MTARELVNVKPMTSTQCTAIDSTIIKLADKIIQLRESVEDLMRRLEPIMTPRDCPPAKAEQPKTQVSSPINQRLEGILYEVDTTFVAVVNSIQQLEI